MYIAYLLQGKGTTIFIAICIDELQGCKIESKSFFLFNFFNLSAYDLLACCFLALYCTKASFSTLKSLFLFIILLPYLFGVRYRFSIMYAYVN